MSGMPVKGEYILQTVTWREDREAQARGTKELIRCKDCKKNPKVSFVGCPLAAISRTDDDFCSRAEREEE